MFLNYWNDGFAQGHCPPELQHDVWIVVRDERYDGIAVMYRVLNCGKPSARLQVKAGDWYQVSKVFPDCRSQLAFNVFPNLRSRWK